MSGTNLHCPICFHDAMINQTQNLLPYNEYLDDFSTQHSISAAYLPCFTPQKRPWYAHTTLFFFYTNVQLSVFMTIVQAAFTEVITFIFTHEVQVMLAMCVCEKKLLQSYVLIINNLLSP